MFDPMSVPPEGFGTPVGEVLAALAGGAPGPAAVAHLCTLDPALLSRSEQVDLLVGLERQAAWLAACQVRVLAAMGQHAGPAGRPGEDFTREEVTAALRIAPVTAERRLAVARALVGRLPGTLAALSAGEISYRHAAAVVEATEPLDDPTARVVEERVLGRAGEQTPAELRRALRRAVIVADPPAAAAAHERAAAGRRVELWPLPDGMAAVHALLPAPDAMTVYTALTALAGRPAGPADPRGIDARRADTLVGVFTDLLAAIPAGTSSPAGASPAGEPTGTGTGGLPVRQGRRPHIQVTVAATTLLGLDQQPAELAGYGPITADTARRIAATGTWRRLLTDPAGRLLDYGRTTYRPPTDLTDHITTRDHTCTFPHCTQPAVRCDIDHATPWDHGGPTNPTNCHALCRRHHRAKTHAGWQLTRPDQHTTTWTSPTGHTYTTHPPPHTHDP